MPDTGPTDDRAQDGPDQEMLECQQQQSMPPYRDEMHVIKVVNSHSHYWLDWGQSVCSLPISKCSFLSRLLWY